MRRTIITLAAAASLVAILAIGANWYLTVYDTAIGKCNRGDPAACSVAAAQRAEILRRVAEGVFATSEPTAIPVDGQATTNYPTNQPAGPSCTLGIAGHDMQVTIGQPLTCGEFMTVFAPPNGAQWTGPFATEAPGGKFVCEVTYAGGDVVVLDTGGEYYGGALCQTLQAAH